MEKDALIAPMTVEVKEPRAFSELGLVFSYFAFLLLEPWIIILSGKADCDVC